MGVSEKHPEYLTMRDRWVTLQDCYEGEDCVKQKGTEYLPPTPGMIADGLSKDATINTNSEAWRQYCTYRDRAVYPDFVAESVEKMIGMMHRKPPVISLPTVMEPMRNKATVENESLAALLRRINEAQLVTGRCGVLADLPKGESRGGLPYLTLYDASCIINWDAGTPDETGTESLNLVVLDETTNERQGGFSWKERERYRVLVLGDLEDNEAAGDLEAVYNVRIYANGTASEDAGEIIVPEYQGQPLNAIPFVFINSKDTKSSPDKPPMMGLARQCLAIYRGDADYRQVIFMQGQETLIVEGGNSDEGYTVGATASITVPQGGKAYYIGVSGESLSEMRLAKENDMKQAVDMGGRMIDQAGKRQESGEALGIRLAASTATLNQVALASAHGLEQILRAVAQWIGANPDEVSVEPNLDFTADVMQGKTIKELYEAKALGAKISDKSIHNRMRDHGITDMDYEEELEEIAKEEGDDLTNLGNDAA